MGIGALFTIAGFVNSNIKKNRLRNMLRDRGVDETTINQALNALDYLGLDEKEKQNMYKREPSLDRKDLERKMSAVLYFIFQYLEVAEFVIGDREKARQINDDAKAIFAPFERKKDMENEKGLSLTQAEASVVLFCIIYYVDKLNTS
jgi:hypothetical protein